MITCMAYNALSSTTTISLLYIQLQYKTQYIRSNTTNLINLELHTVVFLYSSTPISPHAAVQALPCPPSQLQSLIAWPQLPSHLSTRQPSASPLPPSSAHLRPPQLNRNTSISAHARPVPCCANMLVSTSRAAVRTAPSALRIGNMVRVYPQYKSETGEYARLLGRSNRLV